MKMELNLKNDGRPTFSVIIVGFQSQRVIIQCIEAIIKEVMRFDRFIQLIIVDNDPEQQWETIETINSSNFQWPKSLQYKPIRSPRNDGFSFGCNLGASFAIGEWLLFLNPDAFIQENFFIDLFADITYINQCVSADYPVIMGMTMLDTDGNKIRNGGILPELFAFHRLRKRDIFESGFMIKVDNHDRDGFVWPLGAGLLVSNAVYTQHGGFDEDLFLTLEEPSFLKKVQRYILYFSRATLLHDGGHSYSNKLAEYNVFYKSLKHYSQTNEFTKKQKMKLLVTLCRVKLKLILGKITIKISEH